MKKGLIIGIIVVVIVLLGSLGSLLFSKDFDSINCIPAGNLAKSSSSSPVEYSEECCEGLVEISGCNLYKPDNEFADENGCVSLEGCGLMCSNCGDNICSSWEDQCTCPEDCQ